MASQPMIVSEHPPRNVLSPSGRYKRTGTLLSHKQPILTLAISRNGKYIASGGIEGIKIWDLKSHKELPFPSQTVEQRGQVTCCTWITRSSDDSEVICYGTGLGYVVFLKEDGGLFQEILSRHLQEAMITCVAWDLCEDRESARIAIATYAGLVQVWLLDSGRQLLRNIFSLEMDKIVPGGVFFVENPVKAVKDVQVFGVYDGSTHVLNGSDGTVVKSGNIGSVIGGVDLCNRDKLVVVDSVLAGFNLHKLDKTTFVRNFPTGKPKLDYGKQVCFVEDCRAIVGGSDHGMVYIFDRETGATIDMLLHAPQGMVQTIAIHEGGGKSTIACASTGLGDDPSISLWSHSSNNDPGDARALGYSTSSFARGVTHYIKLAFIFVIIGLLWEGMKGASNLEDTRLLGNRIFTWVQKTFDLEKIHNSPVYAANGEASANWARSLQERRSETAEMAAEIHSLRAMVEQLVGSEMRRQLDDSLDESSTEFVLV